MAAYSLKRDNEQLFIGLEGNLTAMIVPALQADLKQTLHEGVRRMAFDFSKTAMLDSSGIGLLIAATNSVMRNGGEVRVVNVAPDIFRLFQNMRLTARLNVSPRAA